MLGVKINFYILRCIDSRRQFTLKQKILKLYFMHQSIPAVPITPGISRAFADILISGVGHLKFFTARGRAFAYPPGGSGAFDTHVRFWSRT